MDTQAKIIAGDIGVQTRAVLETVAATLHEHDAGMADVVRVMVWLSDLQDFAAFNEEYRRHFVGCLPARSTVGATLFGGARIEIEVQALVDPS
jgi:enamine deaminase RidA (YjgF/YER057c/UK114 family)